MCTVKPLFEDHLSPHILQSLFNLRPPMEPSKCCLTDQVVIISDQYMYYFSTQDLNLGSNNIEVHVKVVP